MHPRDCEIETVKRAAKRRPLSRHPLAPREMRIPLTEIERELYKRYRARYRKSYRRKRFDRWRLFILFVMLYSGVTGYASRFFAYPNSALLLQQVLFIASGITGYVLIARPERRLRFRALAYAGIPPCRRCSRPLLHQSPRCGFCGFPQ